MSIIGAAGVGVAISGIIIRFQKYVYDQKIADLQSYVAKLDDHLARLESYKSEIPGFWGDETGKNFMRIIDTQIMQLRNARQSVDNLSKLYDNLKAALDSSQQTVSDKVSEISGIVGALTGLTE